MEEFLLHVDNCLRNFDLDDNCNCFNILMNNEEFLTTRVLEGFERQEETICPFSSSLTTEESRSHESTQTLPKNVCLKRSNNGYNGCSIWSCMKIPKGIKFGPYEGIILYEKDEVPTNSHRLQVLTDEHVDYFVDFENEHRSNWLNYINFSCHQELQNLVILKYNRQIYYQTVKDILPDTELLVWYGDSCTGYFERSCDGKETNVFNNISKNVDLSLISYERTRTNQIQLQDTDMKQFETSATINLDKYLQMLSKDEICLSNGEFGDSSKFQDNFVYMYVEDQSLTNLNEMKFVHTSELKSADAGERPFVCDICGRRFSLLGNLKAHHRVHTGEKPFVCDICGKRFTRNDCLKQHKNIHTGEKPYVCELCGKGFADGGSLKRHQRVHTGEKPYACDMCNKKFVKNSYLKDHKNTHTGEKPYVCDFCGRGFADSSTLKRHQRMHTGEKPYTCNLCGKGFARNSNLKVHKCTGNKSYVCEKSFTQDNNLIAQEYMHIEIECDRSNIETCVQNPLPKPRKSSLNSRQCPNTGKKVYVCDVCEKGFTERSSLRKHQLIHTGIKPYVCDLCGKRFLYNNSFYEHKLRHSGEKSFLCDLCGKRFAVNNKLQLHKRVHTGEKPYSCDVCGKRFAINGNLKQHRRMHTGEKPYSCRICEKKFVTNSGLRKHYHTHKEEKSHTSVNCVESNLCVE